MIKVKLSDGKVLKIEEPKEVHQIEYIDMVDQAEKGKITTKQAIEWQNNQIKELSKLSDEDLEKMPLIDKSKIKTAIISRYVIIGPCSEKTDF